MKPELEKAAQTVAEMIREITRDAVSSNFVKESYTFPSLKTCYFASSTEGNDIHLYLTIFINIL